MKRHATTLILGLLTLGHVVYTEILAPHIAIIGGGIGGASTSHFLTELLNGSLTIELYEAKTIGGRLANLKIDNIEVEAGGAIIHPKNMYMEKFVQLLGLEKRPSSPDEDDLFGIWNGNEFVFIQSSWSSVTLLKLWYRYGFQVYKLDRHVKDILENFITIYDLQDAGMSFSNVTALLSAMNKEFPKLLQTSMKDHLLRMGFEEKLIDELAQASVVVNYGQETNIQSFVGAVSLTGSGFNLWSVKGGNKKVPEHLIYRNKNVNVIPGIVARIRYSVDSDSRKYEVTYTNKDGTNPMISNYDIVIIAAPLTRDQEFPIEFVGFGENWEFPGNYQTTYATFVKADRLNPEYFGLQDALNVLSCNPNKTIISSVGKVDSVDGAAERSSRIWKIFSRMPLETHVVHDMFSHVIEKKQIAWKAYPRYSVDRHIGNFKLHDALYHVNAIEWAASAMEMSAIAGRNVAILAHDDLRRKCTSYPGSIPSAFKTKMRKTEYSEL